MRSRSEFRSAMLALLHVLAVVALARGASAEDELMVSDEDVSVSAKAEGAPPKAAAVPENVAAQTPALFAMKLQVEVATGDARMFEMAKGDSPNAKIAAFLKDNDLDEETGAKITDRVINEQMRMAWESQIIREERAQSGAAPGYAAKPALFNLTLRVKITEDSTNATELQISQGQTPQEAAELAGKEYGFHPGLVAQVADALADDQLRVSWELSAQQFGSKGSELNYTVARIEKMSMPELRRVQDAAGAAILARRLFTLVVDFDGGGHEERLVAHDGDDVEGLARLFAERYVERIPAVVGGVAGATARLTNSIFLAFRELFADGVRPDHMDLDLVRWYDLLHDSFKPPRAWEKRPPRGKTALFQVTYPTQDSAAPMANVTFYTSDTAIEVGTAFASHYKHDDVAGSAATFARYVASSFKKSVQAAGVAMGLDLRPWEEVEATGLPLFSLQYAKHTIVVHEGDAPQQLAATVAKYYELEPQDTNAAAIAKRILGKFETLFPPPAKATVAAAATP